MKIKIITGFRKDQYFTVDTDEAHKAYFLFLNPEMRGVFSNGVAIIGKNIQGIEPDYHATMGWNPEYQLGPDDYAEIRKKGIDRKINSMLAAGKNFAKKEFVELPLSEAIKSIPDRLHEGAKQLAKSFTL